MGVVPDNCGILPQVSSGRSSLSLSFDGLKMGSDPNLQTPKMMWIFAQNESVSDAQSSSKSSKDA